MTAKRLVNWMNIRVYSFRVQMLPQTFRLNNGSAEAFIVRNGMRTEQKPSSKIHTHLVTIEIKCIFLYLNKKEKSAPTWNGEWMGLVADDCIQSQYKICILVKYLEFTAIRIVTYKNLWCYHACSSDDTTINTKKKKKYRKDKNVENHEIFIVNMLFASE